MKLINYNYGYFNQFDCSIHGKIVVSKQEWKDILKYLQSTKVKKSFLPSYSWTNSMLLEDINRPITTKHGTLINIRVPMTSKVVERYNLPRYKKANYIFEILNK